MSNQIHALAIFLSAEQLLFIHLREGRVGPRLGLDGVGEKKRLPVTSPRADSSVSWFNYTDVS